MWRDDRLVLKKSVGNFAPVSYGLKKARAPSQNVGDNFQQTLVTEKPHYSTMDGQVGSDLGLKKQYPLASLQSD